MRASTHFKERWAERVGGPAPDQDELKRLIGESIKLQQFRFYFTPRGCRQKVLALYWHPRRQVVLKVDESTFRGCTVTVLSPKVLEETHEKKERRDLG